MYYWSHTEVIYTSPSDPAPRRISMGAWPPTQADSDGQEVLTGADSGIDNGTFLLL